MSKFTVFDQSSGMYVHPNNFLDPEAPYVFNSYDEALAAKWEILAANRDQKHPDSIDIEPFVVGEEPGGLKRIMEPDDWLIWSIEHKAWWRPDGWGYTEERSEAGRFTFERALEIVTNANRFILDNKPNEAMCPDWGERLGEQNN